MNIWRHIGIIMVVVVAITTTITIATAKDDWPKKPITVIVTLGAGGSADLQTRLEAKYLEPILGVPIKVVNIPGGGHIKGVMSFLKEPADGYTWLRFSPPSTVTGPLLRKTPYHPLKDFQPAFMDITASTALYVRADSPYQTLDEFIEAAKKDTLIMGVNNVGAPPHLAAANLSKQFGVDFKILTFKTIPASMTGLIGGHADAVVGQTVHNLKFEGEVRPLVILDERQPFFEKHVPGVKTLMEMYPDMTAGDWIKAGWTAKKGTDPAIVDKMIDAAKQVFENPEFQKEIANTATLSPVYGTEESLSSIEKGLNFYEQILGELGMLHSK